MSQQQLLFKQELTISQILRTYGKQFTQTQMQYSDGKNGRCAIGVIMSYFGWDGTDEELLMELNDLGMTFDEIADYLDQTNQLTNLK